MPTVVYVSNAGSGTVSELFPDQLREDDGAGPAGSIRSWPFDTSSRRPEDPQRCLSFIGAQTTLGTIPNTVAPWRKTWKCRIVVSSWP